MFPEIFGLICRSSIQKPLASCFPAVWFPQQMSCLWCPHWLGRGPRDSRAQPGVQTAVMIYHCDVFKWYWQQVCNWIFSLLRRTSNVPKASIQTPPASVWANEFFTVNMSEINTCGKHMWRDQKASCLGFSVLELLPASAIVSNQRAVM